MVSPKYRREYAKYQKERSSEMTSPKFKRDRNNFYSKQGFIQQIWQKDCYQFRKWSPARPPKFIIDAGANVGVFSALAAHHYPECKIFSFEVLDEIFNIFEKNMKKKIWIKGKHKFFDSSNIVCYNKALIGDNKPIGVWKHPHNIGGNTCIYDNNKSYRGKDRFDQEWTPQQIDSLSLSEFFEEQQIDFIDFLKMDVEGSEYEILFHADKNGLIPRIHALSMEIHGKPSKNRIAPEYEQLISMLKSNYKNFVQKDNMVFCSLPITTAKIYNTTITSTPDVTNTVREKIKKGRLT